MPNEPDELTRAFAALGRDAERARPAPAAAVRRRADRRLAMQSLAGIVAVGVLVAGVTTGVRVSLGDPPDPVAPPLVPTVTAAPPPSSPPSVPPSTPPSVPPFSGPHSVPPVPEIPDSIPSRAFCGPQTGTAPSRRGRGGSPGRGRRRSCAGRTGRATTGSGSGPRRR